jgi:hypothetical protein
MRRSQKNIGFFLVLMLLAMQPVKGQLISVQSLLSSDSMMIGDQLQYTLRVDAAKGVKFQMPLITDTLSSTLEVLAPLSADTMEDGGRTVVQHHYLVTGFETGMQMLPGQEVIYILDEVRDTARSMPLMIKVFAPEVDTSQQIMPIKPPLNTPVTFLEALPWAGAGLGGLLLVGLVVLLIIRYLRKRGNTTEGPSIPLEPAHVIAFRQLDKLKEEKIWEQGLVKEFYTDLTEVTRQYIERQYAIPAMESTTDEILQAFRRSNPEDSLLDEMLKELLELADLVKFAKEDPLPVHNLTNLNNAYIFIQKTYPRFFREEREEATDAAD